MALSGQWRPRIGELAEFLGMDSTTMTAAVKTLGKRGLVSLVPDPEDARARRLALTEDGREVVAKAVPLWREEHARVQAELVGEDPLALARTLGELR
ncbi:transcriptional regulator, MarR family [Rubellimicrobium mesophilum DSM 19309]|uniref:Transcriptional regulator, MarR family n=1 Tax=Rubellimicrobium mesophilum DSM 19309 TaxID=442562 RepID=A0A017HQE2_9RHOB|nr:transcriptional regulator, MarR family [Rubellimicrobium mesophilum DSM 19309]